MSDHARRHRADLPLPLTERPTSDAPNTTVSDESVRRLVETFYDEALRDDLLAPVFERFVADWTPHLSTMCRFWTSVALRRGGYAGRPLEVHRRIAAISPGHFERWLSLWRRTVERTLPAADRALFIEPAERMAAAMSSAMWRGGAGPSGGDQPALA